MPQELHQELHPMPPVRALVEHELDRAGGILRLRPTFARRFYKDGGRLGRNRQPGGSFQKASGLYVPERWIASTVEAANPLPLPGEGLSVLDLDRRPGARVTLRDALQACGERLLGPERHRRHPGEFRVLTKILDGFEPIVFHLHATDAQVRRHPGIFRGHRFGKDEAYYFLDAPKGNTPYTHFGLHPGVTKKDLLAAIERGGGKVLELSPHYLQNWNEGFHTPAAIPHRPGTALTLEIQQPSDVYTLLETESAGVRMTPKQIHPGFRTMEEALDLIDFRAATDPDLFQKYRLIPSPVGAGWSGAGEAHWIFPPTVSRKFSGKRFRVRRAVDGVERGPFALFVWKGEGALNGLRLRAGDEFFVGAEAAQGSHRLVSTGGVPLECFKLFPPD
jgi:hypothetical protein